MFNAEGETVQPSEVLYKKPILVERGRFRPPTKLTLDMLEQAKKQFLKEPAVAGQTPIILAEMTLRSFNPDPNTAHEDFLARADILRALGFDVLISRFEAYYQLAEYLAAYTDGMIGLVIGLPTLNKVADEKYYGGLPGGMLENVGRLFKRSVKMYVHPTRDPITGEIHTLENSPQRAPWHHLTKLLIEIGRVEPIREYNESYLSIRSEDVLTKIMQADPTWESMVPPAVAELIKTEKLFGWKSAPK
jgi:hypothetical protein